MAFGSAVHEITKPVLVIAEDVITGAAGAVRFVVMVRVLELALPLLLVAVIRAVCWVFGKNPVKVADVVVDDDGVAVAPSSV